MEEAWDRQMNGYRKFVLSIADGRVRRARTWQSGNSRSGRTINEWLSGKAVYPNTARTN